MSWFRMKSNSSAVYGAPGYIVRSNQTADIAGLNFIAVKLGDANLSWSNTFVVQGGAGFQPAAEKGTPTTFWRLRVLPGAFGGRSYTTPIYNGGSRSSPLRELAPPKLDFLLSGRVVYLEDLAVTMAALYRDAATKNGGYTDDPKSGRISAFNAVSSRCHRSSGSSSPTEIRMRNRDTPHDSAHANSA